MELFVLIISIVSAICGLISMFYSLYIWDKIVAKYGKEKVQAVLKRKHKDKKFCGKKNS